MKGALIVSVKLSLSLLSSSCRATQTFLGHFFVLQIIYIYIFYFFLPLESHNMLCFMSVALKLPAATRKATLLHMSGAQAARWMLNMQGCICCLRLWTETIPDVHYNEAVHQFVLNTHGFVRMWEWASAGCSTWTRAQWGPGRFFRSVRIKSWSRLDHRVKWSKTKIGKQPSIPGPQHLYCWCLGLMI